MTVLGEQKALADRLAAMIVAFDVWSSTPGLNNREFDDFTEKLDRLRSSASPGFGVACVCRGTPSYGGEEGHEFSGSCTCCRDTCLGTGLVGG